MTSEPTIRDRAARCRDALIGYAEDGLFTALIDLLADAMHWCDESGEDFHYALCVAGKHYLAELNDEQTEERRLTP
jgi:hypothetical protein